MDAGNRSLIDSQEKIGWNPVYRIEILPDEGVFLFSEAGNLCLKGKTYLLLAPLLQEGKYCVDELVELLQDRVAPSTFYYALARLEKKNLLQENVQQLPRETAAFCSLLQIPEAEAAQHLCTAKIHVQSFAKAIDPQVDAALKEWGMTLVPTAEEADFSVVFVEDYLQPELVAFNRSAFARKHPWMPVRPFGSQIWMGPVYHSGHPGCHECLALRLKTNRLEETYVQQKMGLPHLFPPSHAMLSVIEKWAWMWAAAEVFKRVVMGKNDPLANKLLTFDFVDFTLKEHFLTQLPHCSCCAKTISNPAQLPEPPVLISRKRRDDNEGGYRCVSPEETLKKYAHHVSPITGVVQYLEPSPQPEGSSIHVYHGGHNRALAGAQRGSVKSFRSASGGKGTTDAQSKVGCLCESIERASGEFRGNEPRIRGSYLELKEKAVDPHSVLLFSQQQYLDREKTNPGAHHFHYVPAPPSREMQLEWTPIWSLTEQTYKYYPTHLCYFGYSARENKDLCRADSSGCAAGNCLEEAILQGFFELVERDSVAIWWYNRLHRAEVDLKSLQNPFINSLLKDYAQVGREVWVLDITSDLGIPSFAALSRLKNSAKETILFGFGTHLDPSIGILRALTEMNQCLVCLPSWEEPGVDVNRAERDWCNLVTVDNQPWLKGYGQQSASDFTGWESADLLEDICHCQNKVESLGMEMLLLDQTREEIGLSVVRVIVPGLRHFWPRFAPGRLYDVPVKMQWLQVPKKEEELNPIGVFL